MTHDVRSTIESSKLYYDHDQMYKISAFSLRHFTESTDIERARIYYNRKFWGGVYIGGINVTNSDILKSEM